MMESERRFWRDDAGKVERTVSDSIDALTRRAGIRIAASVDQILQPL